MTLTLDKTTVTLIAQDLTLRRYTKPLVANPAHPDMADGPTVLGAAGITNLEAVVNLWEAVSNAKVDRIRVAFDLVSDNAGTPAGDWDDKASVVADLDTPGKTATIYIPAPRPGIFINDGALGTQAEVVDPADTDLLNWVTLFQATQINSDTVPKGVFLISDGEELSDNPNPRGRKI